MDTEVLTRALTGSDKDRNLRYSDCLYNSEALIVVWTDFGEDL
jgi:hypothetical protein